MLRRSTILTLHFTVGFETVHKESSENAEHHEFERHDCGVRVERAIAEKEILIKILHLKQQNRMKYTFGNRFGVAAAEHHYGMIVRTRRSYDKASGQ